MIDALAPAAAQFGAGSGASHLVTGHSQPHHALEEELAAFCGRERALLFSTGYMANLGVIAAFAGRGESVLEDRLNHASLIDGARLSGARLLRYAHADAAAAGRVLAGRDDVAAARHRRRLQHGRGHRAARRAGARSRRAHAPGCWSMTHMASACSARAAAARSPALGLDATAVPLLVGTLGKAFGTFGAFVAGAADTIDYLLQQARTYIYTTALPPAVAAATRVALRLAAAEEWRRERLQQLIARFRAAALAAGLRIAASTTPIQPLIVGDDAAAVRVSDRAARGRILGGGDPAANRAGGQCAPAHHAVGTASRRRGRRTGRRAGASTRCAGCTGRARAH